MNSHEKYEAFAMQSAPEFSRLISVEGIIPDKDRLEKIEATVDECAALAKRFDLRELSNFKAEFKIRRVAGGTAVKINGVLRADLVQACVVSLRDVFSKVDARFETFFAEPAEQEEFDDEDVGLEGDEDAPEMINNGMIDLGEVAAQYLYLEIDPYPRAPGVSLAAQMTEIGASAGKSNPFRVLEGLKDKDK